MITSCSSCAYQATAPVASVGGRKVLVERDAAVGLAVRVDLADRQGGIATDRLARREQQRLRPGDLDLLGVRAAVNGVASR